MTIDIAYYISKVESLMGEMLDKAEEGGNVRGFVSPDHQKKILLPEVFDAATELAKDIYNEVVQREGRSYGTDDNELQLLAFAVMWSAWSAWVFKSKSEDAKRPLREVAKADSKYVKSMISNAMSGGENLGKDGGRPEGKKELINIA